MGNIAVQLIALAVILAFVIAFIIEMRRESLDKGQLLARFAENEGLRFAEEDDGTAVTLSQGFDGFAQFISPTHGKSPPRNIVIENGTNRLGCMFSHLALAPGGYTREWMVAVHEAPTHLCSRASIQFLRRDSDSDASLAPDPIMASMVGYNYDLIVHGTKDDNWKKITDKKNLEILDSIASDLPFRPEIQVRDKRIAVYMADRGEEIRGMKGLNAFWTFSNQVVSCLAT